MKYMIFNMYIYMCICNIRNICTIYPYLYLSIYLPIRILHIYYIYYILYILCIYIYIYIYYMRTQAVCAKTSKC